MQQWEQFSTVFHLLGRQAEGFLESLFMLMGIELVVPDHSNAFLSLATIHIWINRILLVG
ncbi:transposase [Nostoc sp. FACHB-280]|uniref:transposase n=1 Tax=Nostoc sp. FACHB-280 TaxID=2692839 RepID=UPI002410F67D|nr:transposase [Nostoc sp. FACHB-280]